MLVRALKAALIPRQVVALVCARPFKLDNPLALWSSMSTEHEKG
jgi:hypothetical protein